MGRQDPFQGPEFRFRIPSSFVLIPDPFRPSLVSLLPSNCSRKLFNLYTEYEARQSAESKVVKELDRFDVMLQAFQYERSEWTRAKRVVRFDEFFTSAVTHIYHPKLRPMVQRIIEERDHFWNTEVVGANGHEDVAGGSTTTPNGAPSNGTATELSDSTAP